MISIETLALAKNLAGGGSGGSDLPKVTPSDNGKVLGVRNGKWEKVNNNGYTAGTGIDITNGVISLDVSDGDLMQF